MDSAKRERPRQGPRKHRTWRWPAGVTGAVVLVAATAMCPMDANGEVVELTVVHTNDVHGGIAPSDATFMSPEFPPRLGGAPSMLSLLEIVRSRVDAEGGHLLLVDSGDIFQGTPIGTLSRGRAVVDFMNEAGYDVMSLGNHEFDEGIDNVRELVRRAEFPVLGANLLSATTGERVPWVESWIIKDFGDLRVGILGLITPETKESSFPANVANLEFAPMAPVAREAISELKAEGVDLILVVGHVPVPYDREAAYESRRRDGWPDEADPHTTAMDVAHDVTGIDAMFCGHFHKGFDDAWVSPRTHTLLFQTYGRGSGAGIVTFHVDTETNQIVDYEFWSERGYLVTFFEYEFWPDPAMAEFIDGEQEAAEEGMDRVIGHAAGTFRRGDPGSPMGNAVCDAAKEATGADFALWNLGGVRDEITAGPVTPRDVFQVLPFGNQIVTIEMDGALLREIIETKLAGSSGGLYTAGGKITYSRARPDFDRVTRFEVGGVPWAPDATYRVATSDFLAEGNSNLTMLGSIPRARVLTTGTTMREALEAWFQRNSPVTPVVDDRWTRDDSSEPLSTHSTAF
ncbi:bifunctional metallophosphatase/5'-nucleotidase [bacterium]|nr:bifunctional metallophosphatase/5'-nucleotidase [bacterium]